MSHNRASMASLPVEVRATYERRQVMVQMDNHRLYFSVYFFWSAEDSEATGKEKREKKVGRKQAQRVLTEHDLLIFRLSAQLIEFRSQYCALI